MILKLFKKRNINASLIINSVAALTSWYKQLLNCFIFLKKPVLWNICTVTSW